MEFSRSPRSSRFHRAKLPRSALALMPRMRGRLQTRNATNSPVSLHGPLRPSTALCERVGTPALSSHANTHKTHSTMVTHRSLACTCGERSPPRSPR